MHQFFDPSLKPIVTTDMDGNILYVRTNGLHYYGYPDIIMENHFDNYEDIFLVILDRIFELDFDINCTWSYNGKLIKFEIREDELAHITSPNTEDVRIITILDPFTGQPAKYKTKGLSELFNHPEAEVNGDTIFGKEMLLHLVDEVKEGLVYDEDCSIIYDSYEYFVIETSDRLGNKIFEIQLHQNAPITKKSIKEGVRRRGHLQRIK